MADADEEGREEAGKRPRPAATTPPLKTFPCTQAAMQCPPTKAGRPTTHWPPWETASLECLGRITPYTPRCQRRDSLAKDKLTEVRQGTQGVIQKNHYKTIRQNPT